MPLLSVIISQVTSAVSNRAYKAANLWFFQPFSAFPKHYATVAIIALVTSVTLLCFFEISRTTTRPILIRISPHKFLHFVSLPAALDFIADLAFVLGPLLRSIFVISVLLRPIINIMSEYLPFNLTSDSLQQPGEQRLRYSIQKLYQQNHPPTQPGTEKHSHNYVPSFLVQSGRPDHFARILQSLL